jgi:chromosome segregation ATPase
MFNKKYKMEIEQLKQENEQLKGQITGLAFNLRNADEKIKMYEAQFDAMQKHISELNARIEHLSLQARITDRNQNDSRYY